METQEVPFEHTWLKHLKTLFHCEDDQALALVAQNDDGVSICGDSQKTNWTTILGVSAWAGGWSRWPSEIPSKLNHSVILSSFFS